MGGLWAACSPEERRGGAYPPLPRSPPTWVAYPILPVCRGVRKRQARDVLLTDVPPEASGMANKFCPMSIKYGWMDATSVLRAEPSACFLLETMV